MKLERLAFSGWRNLEQGELTLHPRLNVFFGENAQGKTNLLEAVQYLSVLRSFRATRSHELVSLGLDEARLAASVHRDRDATGLTHKLDVRVRAGHRQARRDGKAVASVADWVGRFGAVLFSPEELRLPKASPAERRRFLDRAIFTANPTYLANVQDYERTLRNRNALLRQHGESGRPTSSLRPLIETYDEQLSRLGADIAQARLAFLEAQAEVLASGYEAITRSGLTVSIRYVTATPTAEALAQALGQALMKDLARGFTSVGPHSDDFESMLGGRSAAAYASQGQLRALMLALKLAEVDWVSGRLGEPPVLLLDDVSSELDPLRNRYLFEHIGSRAFQCLVTTTDRRYVLGPTGAAFRQEFLVHRGRIAPQAAADTGHAEEAAARAQAEPGESVEWTQPAEHDQDATTQH